MPGPMEILILLGGLAILVIFITLVVVGTLKLLKRKGKTSSQTE